MNMEARIKKGEGLSNKMVEKEIKDMKHKFENNQQQNKQHCKAVLDSTQQSAVTHQEQEFLLIRNIRRMGVELEHLIRDYDKDMFKLQAQTEKQRQLLTREKLQVVDLKAKVKELTDLRVEWEQEQ